MGFIQKRKSNFAYLRNRLADCEDFLILPAATPNADPSWFGFPISIRENAGVDRVELLRYLDQYRINTRMLFGGNLTRQPYFRGRNYRVSGELSVTDAVMNRTFWVGVWPGLSEEMLSYIADRLNEFFGVGF